MGRHKRVFIHDLSEKLTKIGKFVHFSVDAVLISTVFAGVRRSTGLTLKVNNVENKDAQGVVAKYLEVGEWVFDLSSSFMSSSPYFERRLP